MNPLRTGFISERVRVTPPLSADPLRYEYLNLKNAEPNLGAPSLPALPSFNDFILISTPTGNRTFKTTEYWDSTYSTFKTQSGTFLTKDSADLRYYQLTGGEIIGNVYVQGNIVATGGVSALSATYVINAVTSFSALSVFSYGYEPALLVGSQGGQFDIARFVDSDSMFPVFSIKDTNNYNTGRGRVGVNTVNPTVDFTVQGAISSSDSIYFGRYNTLQLIDLLNITQNNSGGWESTESTVYSLSNDWASSNIIPIATRYLSSYPVTLNEVTITNGLSVRGGLSADMIYGVFQSNKIQRFAGNGVTVTWQLENNISSQNDILVYVGGIYQDKVTYSVNPGPPSSITFTEAPPLPSDYVYGFDNKNVEIVYLNANPFPIGQVGDGTVTESKIGDRAVTSNKLGSNLTLVGNLSVTGTLSAAGYVLTNSFIPYQTFDVLPNQTIFTLLCAVATKNDISVYVSGIYQNKDNWDLLDRYNVQLTTPPPVGFSVVEITYNRPFPSSSMYPTVNSVLTDSINNGAVTSPKLNSNIKITNLTVSNTLSCKSLQQSIFQTALIFS
jgi:hypothetical protein